MEDLSTAVLTEESKSEIEYIEIYDIIMKDGTHYRFCTASTDHDFVDYETT